MPPDILPDPSTPFGERVRQRLRDEQVIWLTSVGADGTPQPNPVWFVFDGDHALIYNRPDANRLNHIRSRPQVSLHLDGNGRGGDIVVLTGRARLVENAPQPHLETAYLAKYRDAMIGVSGSIEKFGADYPIAVRVDVTRVRGF